MAIVVVEEVKEFRFMTLNEFVQFRLRCGLKSRDDLLGEWKKMFDDPSVDKKVDCTNGQALILIQTNKKRRVNIAVNVLEAEEEASTTSRAARLKEYSLSPRS